MKPLHLMLGAMLFIAACQPSPPPSSNIVTSDIQSFWEAYDKIISTDDTLQQAKYLKELFLDKSSPGQQAMMDVRQYTAERYLDAIHNYPKFWNSIRENSKKAASLSADLEKGIEKLRRLYPSLSPAKIYFTMGILRSNGTTLDSMVLIGSEQAMADQNTVTEEFPEEIRAGKRTYFDSNPIKNLVLLNVHEYVHTQQKPMVYNLLSQCIYEGVAEFVSTIAMEEESVVPAVQFGKANLEAVRDKFERDMFTNNKTNEWLWSDAENGFGVRDLGYFIGYEICERYYNNATDKSKAIKDLIELDYENETEVERIVDGTNFLTASLKTLYQNFEANRPKIVRIQEFENGNTEVSPSINTITLECTKPLDTRFRSTGLGELGKEHFPKVNSIDFSEDSLKITYQVVLEPNMQYQILLENGYRTTTNNPLKPYLVDFKTKEK